MKQMTSQSSFCNSQKKVPIMKRIFRLFLYDEITEGHRFVTYVSNDTRYKIGLPNHGLRKLAYANCRNLKQSGNYSSRMRCWVCQWENCCRHADLIVDTRVCVDVRMRFRIASLPEVFVAPHGPIGRPQYIEEYYVHHQARSQDCQNEEADRSSAPSPPLPSPLFISPLFPSPPLPSP